MNIKTILYLFCFILLTTCKENEINFLKVYPEELLFPEEGSSFDITLETDASSWKIENPAYSWLVLSVNSGNTRRDIIKATVNTRTTIARFDTLTVFAGNAIPKKIKVFQKASEFLYTINVSINRLEFLAKGNSLSFNIFTDASNWSISSNVDWLLISPTNGTNGTTKITVTALTNNTGEDRFGKIYIEAQYAKIVEIDVVQSGQYFPSYNINPLLPDTTGMRSNAKQIVEKIKVGWNLGNSLEAIGGETAWGNPIVTKNLITLVKNSGFNAIRIPCSWYQYMVDVNTAEINKWWLQRVREVVQYCIDNDMYVILNIHWDGGWLENNCTPEKQQEVKARQKAFWEQIATYMRDFDERLMFSSANEPNVENPIQMNVLNSYHQAFIDAVRSTGGRNYYRVLVIQGPSTDIEKTYQMMNILPTDVVENRLIIEIHYYTPYQFCLMTEDANWGKMFYFWGKDYHSTTMPDRNATWGEESTMNNLLNMMKSKFVDKGIPVIIGEFAVIRRTNLSGNDLELHLNSRAYFLRYLTRQARLNGIVPFYWDAGNMGNNSSALFDRFKNNIYDSQALNAIMEGAE